MKRFVRQLVVAVVVIAAAWYVLRNVDIHQLVALIAQSNIWLISATIPIIIASHVVRASRWRRLLTQAAKPISLLDAFGAVMIGYAASAVIPRSGEVLRPLYLTRKTSIPMGATVSSVVVERLLDVLALLVGILLLFMLQADRVTAAFPQISAVAIVTTIVAPVVAVAAMVLLLAFTTTTPRVLVECTARWRPRMAVRVRKALSTIRQGTGFLTATHEWPMVLLETILMWVLYAIPLWMVVSAMPLSISSFGFLDAGMLLMVITVGISVAPTPGALGVYHGFAQAALVRLFHATPDEGLGFALLAWVLNYGVQLAVGGGWFLAQRAKVKQP